MVPNKDGGGRDGGATTNTTTTQHAPSFDKREVAPVELEGEFRDVVQCLFEMLTVIHDVQQGYLREKEARGEGHHGHHAAGGGGGDGGGGNAQGNAGGNAGASNYNNHSANQSATNNTGSVSNATGSNSSNNSNNNNNNGSNNNNPDDYASNTIDSHVIIDSSLLRIFMGNNPVPRNLPPPANPTNTDDENSNNNNNSSSNSNNNSRSSGHRQPLVRDIMRICQVSLRKIRTGGASSASASSYAAGTTTTNNNNNNNAANNPEIKTYNMSTSGAVAGGGGTLDSEGAWNGDGNSGSNSNNVGSGGSGGSSGSGSATLSVRGLPSNVQRAVMTICEVATALRNVRQEDVAEVLKKVVYNEENQKRLEIKERRGKR